MSEGKFIDFMKKLPRVTIANLKPNPGAITRKANRRGQGGKGLRSPIRVRAIGRNLKDTFQDKMPKYGFNRNEYLKRQYVPLTLWKLQRLIDLGRLDPDQPIDITALANCRGINIDMKDKNYYGIYLVEQGANIFQAKVNLEVQIANEMVIAAVEKQGGIITNAFFDPMSIIALSNPIKYFLKGKPIHKRLLPPMELVKYYSDPKVRGYLSDPVKVFHQRQALAKKYGYELPDVTKDNKYEMLMQKKDPRQIFYGLSPGWIVNLADETVIKPDNELHEQWVTL